MNAAAIAIDPATLTDLEVVVAAWHRLFGLEPGSARTLVETAFNEPPLFAALEAIFPGFREDPHPYRLQKWMRLNENRPVALTGQPGRYRFTRDGRNHSFKLAPFVLPVS